MNLRDDITYAGMRSAHCILIVYFGAQKEVLAIDLKQLTKFDKKNMMDKVNFPKTNKNKFFGKSCIFFATCSPRFDYVV